MFKVCKNGIFKSIQGEGANCGQSAVFVRFSGCNQNPPCYFCDESYEEYEEMNQEQILLEVKRLEPFCILVLTGGEPTLQKDLNKLIDSFHLHHYFVAIETNGLKAIPENIDWITCSPKQEYIDKSITTVDEIKLVVTGTKQEAIDRIKVLKKQVQTKYIYLQPVSNQKNSIQTCVEMIHDNPNLFLSVQVHKLIGVK